MELSRTKYNNLAKTPELRKGPEYQGPEMDKDLQYQGPEMEKDLQYQGSVESKTFKQDKKQKTKVNTTVKLEELRTYFICLKHGLVMVQTIAGAYCIPSLFLFIVLQFGSVLQF